MYGFLKRELAGYVHFLKFSQPPLPVFLDNELKEFAGFIPIPRLELPFTLIDDEDKEEIAREDESKSREEISDKDITSQLHPQVQNASSALMH